MRLLCICYECPPQTTPTAIRAGKLLGRLARDGWALDVVTAARDAAVPGASVRHVPPPPASAIRSRLGQLRMGKLPELLDWPDDKRAWVAPATAAGLAAIAEHRPDAIAVFMMPYAAGLVGLELKRRTGLPVLMNFDDSPTCSDMHASFATPWHYHRTVALEDQLVRGADAAVFVSQRNLDRVRDRQPAKRRGNFHLVRYGADPADYAGPPPAPAGDGVFRIVYLGGMTGWYAFDHGRSEPLVKRVVSGALATWNGMGRHHLAELDQRGSSPVFVARAAQEVMAADASLRGRVRVEVYGNRYPQYVVDRLLSAEGVADVVAVHGPVPNAEAIRLARSADLLFMALPDRVDGSPGGRISAKTYEYLMTDRPILAALPPGEGPEFLAGYAGVTVCRPTDVAGMAAAIAAAVARPHRFERPSADLSYDGRAEAFAAVVEGMVGR